MICSDHTDSFLFVSIFQESPRKRLPCFLQIYSLPEMKLINRPQTLDQLLDEPCVWTRGDKVNHSIVYLNGQEKGVYKFVEVSSITHSRAEL